MAPVLEQNGPTLGTSLSNLALLLPLPYKHIEINVKRNMCCKSLSMSH